MIQYGIKNFRKFDSKGCEFSLAPITFFTGCNNSGKSSVSKSLVLLSQMYKRLNSHKEDISFDDLYIDFSDKSINIGDFESVLNRKAGSKEGIVFSFSAFSDTIQRKVLVELTFKKRPSELLNRAHLSSFIIQDELHRDIIKGQDDGSGFLIAITDKPKIELWFYEQALHFYRRNQKDSLSKKQNQIINNLISSIKGPSSDWGSFLYTFFGFQGEYNYYSAIGDLSIVNRDTSADIATSLCVLVNAMRNHRAPFLDDIDGTDKEECKRNIIDVIQKESDPKKQLHLLGLLVDFQKSPFSKLSDYVFHNMKDISYRANKIHHPQTHSIWGGFYDAVYLKYGGATINDEQSVRYLDCLHNSLSVNELDEEELGLFHSSVFELDSVGMTDALVSLYSAIGIFPKNDEYPSEHLFPGHDLFVRLMGFLLYEVFIQREIDECTFFGIRNTDYCSFDGYQYIGTTSVSIKRLYSESDNTDLLTQLILNKNLDYSFTNKWLWKLGLGKSLEVTPAQHGVGFFIQIVSNRGGHVTKTLLPDFGQGVSHLLAILLLADAWGNKNGWTTSRKHYTTLIIEEPEAHLHPSFQSRLADIFLDAYSSLGVRFIIETHSEYLLRKTQVLVANMKYTNNEEADSKAPFHAYYFPKNGKPYSLGYRKDGYFVNSFGKGFYDESSSLTFELL